MDDDTKFSFSDFESSESEVLADFIDDNEFQFPELSCKYDTLSGHKSAHESPRVLEKEHASIQNLEDSSIFDESCVEFGGLEEILTSSHDPEFPIEDLLSFLSSPNKENSESDLNEDDVLSTPLSRFDEKKFEAAKNVVSPKSTIINLSVLESTPVPNNDVLAMQTHAVAPKLVSKPSKKSKRKRNEILRRQQRMYIKCLQEQVSSLLSKQALLDSGNLQQTSEPKLQQSRVRKTHVQMFLTYRTGGIIDRSCWSEVLDEAFILTMPCTPFSQVNGQVIGNKRKLHGIDAIIKDTGALSSFVESLNQRCHQLKSGRNFDVRLVFSADPSDILIVEDKAMCNWKLCTQGLTQMGFISEAEVDGMLYSRFTNQHKLSCMEMTFDVLSFSQQLTHKDLLEVPSFPIVGPIAPDISLSMNMPAFSPSPVQSQSHPKGAHNSSYYNIPGTSSHPLWPHSHFIQPPMAQKKSPTTKILPAKKGRHSALPQSVIGDVGFDGSFPFPKIKKKKKRKIPLARTGPKKIKPCPSELNQSQNSNFPGFHPALMYQQMMTAAAFGAQQQQGMSNNFMIPPQVM